MAHVIEEEKDAYNETRPDHNSHQEIRDDGRHHHHAALDHGDGEKKVDEGVHEVREAGMILHHEVSDGH